ncbi:MAG TPA: VOC family protein [Dehalococcoidia bacterium]|nr:VOC family protein [Dehalococcoidia bacterium]
MITGFNHSGFVVKDLEKMVSFYRDVLGLTVLSEVESNTEESNRHIGIPDAKRMLVFVGKDRSQHQLELVYYLHPQSPEGHVPANALGSTHVCFNVQGLLQMYDELKDRVSFVTPPVVRPTPFGRGAICFAQDPEGNWLEFIERLPAED